MQDGEIPVDTEAGILHLICDRGFLTIRMDWLYKGGSEEPKEVDLIHPREMDALARAWMKYRKSRGLWKDEEVLSRVE